MKNLDVRTEVMKAGIPLWKLAEGLGLAPESLSRKLRHEWTDEEKQKAFDTIERLKMEG